MTTPVRLAVPLLLTLALAGCGTLAPPAHAADLFQQLQSSVLMKGLQTAATNLQNAVKNGDLPADDPAVTCLTGVVVGAVTPAPNATPYTVTDLISLGSVLYIDAHKAGKVQAATQQSCQALIGQFVIRGVQQASPLKLPGQ